MKLLVPATLLVVTLGCSTSSSSYGTPQDCAAAGGQCIIGPSAGVCAKEGPTNTCDCNPACSPGGAYCCVTFVEAGADTGTRD